jgi:hypothetical protein
MDAFSKSTKGTFKTFNQQSAHEFVQVALLLESDVAFFVQFL